MMAFFIIIFAVAIVATLFIYPVWRDRRIVANPFPATWQTTLERRLPFFHRLSGSEQNQIKGLIQLFIARKHFYGCAGLEIDDEIRVTIAAGACLLLLNRNTGLYPKLQHILVYPSAFITPHYPRYQEDGTVSDGGDELSGESWGNGKVILSWDDVEHGPADGQNVLLHEFAHQLDSESGDANGTPLLHRNREQTWAEALSGGLEELIEDIEGGHEPVMDEYGATDEVEFFAVATEAFFDRPHELASRHPKLFGELNTYYCVDPRKWYEDGPAGIG